MKSAVRKLAGALLAVALYSSASLAEPVGCASEHFIPFAGKLLSQQTIRNTDVAARAAAAPLQYIMAITYDPAASAKVGGDAILLQQVETAIAGANQLFDASGVNVDIILGYLEKLTANQDANGNYPPNPCPQCAALNKQVRPNAFAVLHELGLGYADIPLTPSQALNGARLSFGVLNFKKNTLAHEIGHSLGLFHGSRDPINTSNPGTPRSPNIPDYGQGTVVNGQTVLFHTIMSYGDVLNTSVSSGLFSSPNLTFDGVPTGVYASDSLRAIEFWAPYVVAASDRLFPLPISLAVTKNGQQTVLSGKCLDEVGGADSVGATIELFHKSGAGTINALPDAICQEGGFFESTIENSLTGSFQARHVAINQVSEWVTPLWIQLSLFGSIQNKITRFSGVCYDKDGLTPLTGSTVEIVKITDSEYATVLESDCSASGTFAAQLSGSKPGRYEAQIPGVAFSEIIEVGVGSPGNPGSPAFCKKLKKKIKKIKLKRKFSAGKARKKLKKKLKKLKLQNQQC